MTNSIPSRHTQRHSEVWSDLLLVVILKWTVPKETTFSCSKSTIETPEQFVKIVQSHSLIMTSGRHPGFYIAGFEQINAVSLGTVNFKIITSNRSDKTSECLSRLQQ